MLNIMALTEAQITVCNLALGLLDETEINSTDTTDKAYVLCERYYSLSLYELLQRHYWTESKKRIPIGQTGVPLFGYEAEYTLPTDFIRLYRIDDSGYGCARPRDYDEPYVVEDGKLLMGTGYTPEAFDTTGTAGTYYSYDSKAWLCNTTTTDTPSEASDDWTLVSSYGILTNIIYIREIEPTDFSPLLTDCVAHSLAIKVAAGLTRGQDVVKVLRANLEQVLLREAKSIDSMNKFPVQRFSSAWIESRKGR